MSDVRSSEIRTVDVVSDNLYQWGIEVKDYLVGDATSYTDFQDLLIVVCEDRAQVIEKEVEPMATRMDVRNKRLDNLGEALAIIADVQAQFVTEEDKQKSKTSTAALTQKSLDGLKIVGWTQNSKVGDHITLTCSEADYWQQLLKSKIDSLNNASQDDMTRLQSLVDRRDEAYSTATSLMQSAGDTRANTIKNM